MRAVHALSHGFSKWIFRDTQFRAAFVAPYDTFPNGVSMRPPLRRPPTEVTGTKRGLVLFLRRLYTAWKRTTVPVTFTLVS